MSSLPILIIGLSHTWYVYKYSLNSGVWKEGWLILLQSQQLYIWMKGNLPKNSKVYALGMEQIAPIAFDMVSFIWDKEVFDYYVSSRDLTDMLLDNYIFLKNKGYEYVIVDVTVPFYHLNKLDVDLSEKEKQMLFARNLLAVQQKKELMRKLPRQFELVKEIKNAGAIFKIH